MEKRSWLVYVGTYLAWAVVVALGFWLLILSRQVFLQVAARYVGDDIVRGWQVRFYDKVFFIIVALFVLALFTLTEAYLRQGIKRRNVVQRFAKISSVELLLLFVLDVVLMLLYGFGASGWSRWLILMAELALGVVFYLIGRVALRAKLKPNERD